MLTLILQAVLADLSSIRVLPVLQLTLSKETFWEALPSSLAVGVEVLWRAIHHNLYNLLNIRQILLMLQIANIMITLCTFLCFDDAYFAQMNTRACVDHFFLPKSISTYIDVW